MTVGENNPMKGKNDGNRRKGRKRLGIENGEETKHSGIEGKGEGGRGASWVGGAGALTVVTLAEAGGGGTKSAVQMKRKATRTRTTEEITGVWREKKRKLDSN